MFTTVSLFSKLSPSNELRRPEKDYLKLLSNLINLPVEPTFFQCVTRTQPIGMKLLRLEIVVSKEVSISCLSCMSKNVSQKMYTAEDE